MSRGSKWEREIALTAQVLFDEGRAMITRVPTHYHGGVPSHDPKVDFVGLVAGGRFVALEAKAKSGQLTKSQRAYLAAVSRFGGLALAYRHIDGERHLCLVDEDGQMQRKSADTLVTQRTWLDAAEARGL